MRIKDVDDDLLTPRERRLINIATYACVIGLIIAGCTIAGISYSILTGG